MKITLRRASALQNRIQETLKGLTVKTTVSLNEFEDTQALLEQARALAIATDRDRYELTRVQYRIRGLVGNSNSTSGIDTRLTTVAQIDRRITQLNELVVTGSEQTSMTVLTGKLERKRSQPASDRSYLYGHDNIDSGVFSDVDLGTFRTELAQLKLERQRLNDEILEVNVRTEIELDSDTEFTLRRFNLV
jgi:hypothetical protein